LAEGSAKIVIISSLIVVAIFLLSFIVSISFLKIVRWAFLLLLILLIWFFRDPDRTVPVAKGNIVSPADGKIVEIKDHDNRQKVAIFMSLLNVHVNRIPMAGKIIEKKYTAGQYLPAFNPNCYLKNE